jgi:hypothetical protein
MPSTGTADSYDRATVEDMAGRWKSFRGTDLGGFLNARLERLGAGGLQRIWLALDDAGWHRGPYQSVMLAEFAGSRDARSVRLAETLSPWHVSPSW